jgi:hypothetical protein
MQIQYCDDCGTRVDDSEIVGINGKLYCKQCAKSHVALERPGTAVFTSPRASSRTARMARSTSSRPPVVENSFNPPFGTGAAAGDPNYAYGSGVHPSTGGGWIENNKAMAISLGAGAVGIVIVVLWTMNSGPSRRNRTRDTSDNTQVAVSTADNKPDTTTKSTTSVKTPMPPVAPPIPPPVPLPFDARMDKAQRDLQAIKDAMTGGKATPYELRRQLEHLVRDEGLKKTDIGKEAAKLLEKYKSEKRPADKADGAMPGLQAKIGFDKAAELFATNFKVADLKTLTEINYPNKAAIKNIFGRENEVAVKILGFVEVPKAGEYTFYVNSDDGSLLYVGDERLVENLGAHVLTERDGTIDLKQGKHAIRLEYFQGQGEAGLILSWSGPGLLKQVIPASALSSVPLPPLPPPKK